MNDLVYDQGGNDSNAFTMWESGESSGVSSTGKGSSHVYNGAYRFSSVGVSGSVYNATLKMYIGSYANSGTLRFKAYGIKETNTSDFGSNPFGRPKTTNYNQSNTSVPSTGNYINADVTSMVNEILGQGGWSSGNAIGFLILDNGSDTNSAYDDFDERSLLVIQTSAPPNKKPTPVTVSAPTFPAENGYGIRVSKPEKNVKIASESELYFTTRKKLFRIKQERVSLNETSYAHGLAYTPCVFGYFTNVSDQVSVMNYPTNAFSVEPYIGSNATNVILFPETNKPAYTYLCVDPLNE